MDKNININDSDIEIIEHNESIVSIIETDDEINSKIIKDNVVVLDESEEGELLEEKEDEFVFEIKFQRATYFQQKATVIKEALEKAFENTNEPIKCNLSSEDLRIIAFPTTSSNITKLHCASKESSPDLTGIAELFTIDPSPSEVPEVVHVPSYKRSIQNVLDEETNESKRKKTEDSCQRARPSAACFNCGASGHALRDCPKKRDGRRIQNARNKFVKSSDKRYHINSGDQYPKLRPGVISESLRKALSLRTGEIPYFFYRMRVWGYPPGWLEDAKVQPSGLALISADGSKVSLELDSSREENAEQDKYDVSKLIDFPGFNALPQKKFYDDYKHHNVPPMQPSHMKEEFIKSLGNNVVQGGYKRKKITNLTNSVCDDINTHEPTDMEIENEAETVQVVEKVEHVESVCARRVPSPTLADLEAQQLALVQALETGNTSVITIEEESMRKISESESGVSTPKAECTTPIIKESHMGTPLLKFSPFDKLPAGENFKVGVSDVINFENLPDSTGKYEQMKRVIKRVRNIVTQLNNETTD